MNKGRSNKNFELTPINNARLAQLCGPFDENLRQIEATLGVRITHRAEQFAVSGPAAAVHEAVLALQRFYQRTESARGQDLTIEAIQSGLLESARWALHDAALQPAQPSTSALADPPAGAEPQVTLNLPKRPDLAARTPRQAQYLRNIHTHDITFGVGPAGTGKTYLAVACAVDAFERETVKRIVLVRPAVEAGEKLGFLPGDLAQKVDPYLRPLYDALFDLMGYDKVTRLFERGAIEVAPLAFMRGRTLNNSFIILDEAQNTTSEQMKMFLTRMGYGSKAVITGDVTQVDLPHGRTSGLVNARQVLLNVPGIAFSVFQSDDVVRHPLVQKMVDAYERQRS